MIMRLFAGAPREEVLAVAQQLTATAAADRRRARLAALAVRDRHAELVRRIPRGRPRAGATFADARRRGAVLGFAMASQLRSRQRLWTGPVGDAVADARAAVEVWRGGLQAYLHPSGYWLVCGLLDQGDLDDGRGGLALGDSSRRPPASSPRGGMPRPARAAPRRRRRRPEGVPGRRRGLTELRMVNPTLLAWRSEAALAAQRLGETSEARALVAEELALAERFGAPRAIGVARRAAGLLERGEAAVERCASAAELLAACGARIEHARALDRPRRRDPPRRAAPARRASTLREALALAETSARARSRSTPATSSGSPAAARARPRGRGDRLTPSERRVAELAAAGQSNRQIADDAVRHRQGRRVAPRQHLPQARHPRPRRARRRARATPVADAGGDPSDAPAAGPQAA